MTCHVKFLPFIGFPAARRGNIHQLSIWNLVTHSYCLKGFTRPTIIWLFPSCCFPVLLHCHVQPWQPEGFGAAYRRRQRLWWVGGCDHAGQVPLTHDLSPTYIQLRLFWTVNGVKNRFVCETCGQLTLRHNLYIQFILLPVWEEGFRIIWHISCHFM